MRYLTAGESHGPQLTVIIEGLPSQLSLDKEKIDRELARRQRDMVAVVACRLKRIR